MKRLVKLARILRKCSKTENSQSGFMGYLAYFFPIAGILIAVALFYLTYRFADFIELFGGADTILSMSMLVVFSGSILFSVFELTNTLYMSTDLPVLISMPLTVYEIVGARLYNVLIKLIAFDAAIIIPSCLGFGIAAHLSLPFFLTAALGFLIIPLIGLMMTTAVIILLLSLIRVFRNRDMITIVGIICVPLLSIAYIFVRRYLVQELSLSEIGKQALTAMQSVSGISGYVPVISFLTRFYGTGNVLFLLGALGMLLATALILFLFVRFFYLKGALSMRTGTSRRSRADLSSEKMEEKSPIAALTKKELLLILRTPAYLLYGWLCSTFWPILLVAAFFIMNTFSDSIAQLSLLKEGLETEIGISAAAFSCYGAIFLALFTVATNNVAYTAISREGSSHFISKIIPVSYEDQMRAKRNAALIICGFGSVIYTVLGMIWLIVKGLLPVWAVLPVLVTLLATIVFGNAVQLWLGSRFPNLHWNDESVVGKDASRAFWIITLVVIFVFPILMLFSSRYLAFWLVGLPVGMAALAFFMNRFSISSSAKMLAK